MPETTKWVRLVEACTIAGLTQNKLYAVGARGKVRTRRVDGKPLEFLREDLEKLRAEREPAPAA